MIVIGDTLGVGICCPSQPLDFLAGGGPALLDLISGLVVGGGGIERIVWGQFMFLVVLGFGMLLGSCSNCELVGGEKDGSLSMSSVFGGNMVGCDIISGWIVGLGSV